MLWHIMFTANHKTSIPTCVIVCHTSMFFGKKRKMWFDLILLCYNMQVCANNAIKVQVYCYRFRIYIPDLVWYNVQTYYENNIKSNNRSNKMRCLFTFYILCL